MTASGSRSQPRQAAASSGSRIIERPRLIKLLDETDARVILLTAPAGYGKTTLARQWAKTLTGAVWMSLTPRHRDVATLVRDLGSLVPGAERPMNEQLHARLNPQIEAAAFGMALATELDRAKVSWLILDDYHEVAKTPGVDDLVATISRQTSRVRLLLSTRIRPNWMSDRDLIYSEVTYIGPDELAMTETEALSVLGRTDRARDLARSAGGWPVLVGLAAALPRTTVAPRGIPKSLHAFLADELLSNARPDVQRALMQLALLGPADAPTIRDRFGEQTEPLLKEARELGFTAVDGGGLHPLLRQFLLEKLVDEPDCEARVRREVELSLAAGRFENALDLIGAFGLHDLTDSALERCFKPLSRAGKLGTLEAFANLMAHATTFSSPVVDLVAAEIAFRSGNYALAREAASRSAPKLPRGHELASRGRAIVGYVDYILASFDTAEQEFAAALESATDDEDEVEAVNGLVLTNIFGERPRAEQFVRQQEQTRDRSPAAFLRYATSSVMLERFGMGGHRPRISRWIELVTTPLELCEDPRARSAFAYACAGALAQEGCYNAARLWVERVFEEAEKFGLVFALPLANWEKGQIALGQRRFSEADKAIQRVEDFAAASGYRHHEFNARLLRSRLHLQSGDPESALECVRVTPDVDLIPSWSGEYLATRALVCAVLGDEQRAQENAQEATEVSQATFVRVLSAAAVAVSRAQNDPAPPYALVKLANQTACWDPIVCALRASSEFADLLASDSQIRPELAALYERIADTALARRAGIRIRNRTEPSGVLSDREMEILELIALGYTNPKIAEALFISASTVKVHTRHILEKLGVRSRSAAVARLRMFEND